MQKTAQFKASNSCAVNRSYSLDVLNLPKPRAALAQEHFVSFLFDPTFRTLKWFEFVELSGAS